MKKRQSIFTVHLIAFLAMIFSPIGLYYAASSNNSGVVLILLGLVVFSNLLIFITR
jgi:hypothetical protein